MSAAEDITGIARGIAYQLVEALGVLDRSQVAQDVKSLDQAARAALRKHGVRFGAYHLYLPALLKPAPRSLAAQLWALKYGGPELKGLDELQRLASSGRTSLPVDKEVPKPLYRTVGYRVCGERAVRVDILERLADLIRPALAWRPGAAGTQAGRRVRRRRLHRDAADDVAHRRRRARTSPRSCARSAIAWSGGRNRRSAAVAETPVADAGAADAVTTDAAGNDAANVDVAISEAVSDQAVVEPAAEVDAGR